ncbi:MAG: oligopeptidase A [Rhodothermales bacterium]|jgi:oligopeptidase A
MSHPFLAESFPMRWSTFTPSSVVADVALALDRAQANIDGIAKQDLAAVSYDSTLGALELASGDLDRAWSVVSHLDSVCNSDELRAVYNEMLPKVSAFSSSVALNDELWAALKAFADSAEAAALTGVHKRLLDETLAQFRSAGADLPAGKKARFADVAAKLAELTQKFSENCLDATNAWELIIDDEAELAGLPDRAKHAMQMDAQGKGQGTEAAPKWRVTLQAPSVLPILQYADSDDLRKTCWMAFGQIGSGDPWDNEDLVWQILALRQEKADLLGKDNFADIVLERRMAKTGSGALTFVETLHEKSAVAFKRDIAQLEAYAATSKGTTPDALEPWESGYWAEKLRQERYDFDGELLRPYFPVERVIDGMFEICQHLFGIRIEERESCFVEAGEVAPEGVAEVWHPDVHYFELFDAESGRLMGSFYSDWYPRESKRSGAWKGSLFTGQTRTDGSGCEPNVAVIVGNLTKPAGDTPALLSHREVETIFHEFGHLLHDLLGEVPVGSLNGTSVAWDFVELPSQIMENWCWDREGLNRIAAHYETGKSLPDELFEKMIAARNFNAGVAMMGQLGHGKLDLELHLNYATKPQDLNAISEAILDGYVANYKTKGPSMARRFTHLFSHPVGYASGYYSYKWSEVLDADAFTVFQKDGLMNEATGRAFREAILSKGNSAPPEQLFRDFMGRDPNPDALLIRSGLLV